SADEVDALLGDIYPDGVDLVVFDENGVICLTGPAATFVLLGEHGDTLRQIYGPGGCDNASSVSGLEDGDIVVDITFDIVGKDHPRPHYKPRVMKGQNLVDQIPDLVGYLDVLNRLATP
ncbi:MAG: hypothetical protein ABIO16_17855, partial [Nocardioides sp.]